MTERFTQIFLVVPTRPAVGLTSVALGIVRTLQRIGVAVGFAKPVVQDASDKSNYFARTIFNLPVPQSLTLQESAERFAANQQSDLLEEIVAMCMTLSDDADVLVVEGLHADEAHTYAAQLNVAIASSLKAEVVVVTDASLPAAVTDSRLGIGQYVNEGCKVAAVVFNKAPEDFDLQSARALLGGTRCGAPCMRRRSCVRRARSTWRATSTPKSSSPVSCAHVASAKR